jgi:hypothetical protein
MHHRATMAQSRRRVTVRRSRSSVLLFLLLCLLVALLLGAIAGWMVAVFLSLTLLLGGLAVMAINART